MKSKKPKTLHMNLVNKTCTYYTFQRVNVWAMFLHLHILFSTLPPLRLGSGFSNNLDHLIHFLLNLFHFFFPCCYSLLLPLVFFPSPFPVFPSPNALCLSLTLSLPATNIYCFSLHNTWNKKRSWEKKYYKACMLNT